MIEIFVCCVMGWLVVCVGVDCCYIVGFDVEVVVYYFGKWC